MMGNRKSGFMKQALTACALLFVLCLGAVSVYAENEGVRLRQEFEFEDTYTYTMTYPGIQNSYPVNLSALEMDDREYFWGFDFTDGNKLYTVGTFHYHTGEEQETMSLKKMQSELWEHREGGASGWAGDAKFKKKGNKISWTFDVPKDFDNRSFKITRIYTQVQGEYTFDRSTPSPADRWENPLTAKGNTCTVKASALKRRKVLITENAAFTIPDSVGINTYKRLSGSAELSLNEKTGFITVKKGTKAGTYSIRVRITAGGDDWYLPKRATARVKVVVK